MNLRIQTYGSCIANRVDFKSSLTPFTDGTTVYEALEKGFDDLLGLCDVVIDDFTVARDHFKAKEKS